MEGYLFPISCPLCLCGKSMIVHHRDTEDRRRHSGRRSRDDFMQQPSESALISRHVNSRFAPPSQS